jgi:hypothetical protein
VDAEHFVMVGGRSTALSSLAAESVRGENVVITFDLYMFNVSSRVRIVVVDYESIKRELVATFPKVYYESRKRELKRRLINEGRCDERLKAKVEE